MKVFYYTFGCKVNQYETENLRELFEDMGYETSHDYADSQVCIINTCTVTEQSDSKCRQFIRKVKKANPECVLVLTGCFPQAFKEQAEQMTECDIITGSNNKTEIPALVKEFILNGTQIVKILPHIKNEKFEKMSNKGADTKTRAYIKIQDGCNQYCTYCIIPYARGFLRSKPLEDIKKETQTLIDSGHKEIILTGINLCCYGKDFDKNIRLIDAIETACNCNGVFRVRLSSVEPELISDEDILRMSKLKNLCPHFHLSLQSGCDKILKAMNRHYNTNEYKTLCEKLRKYFNKPAITTDIMVGFPNETDEDFKDSIAFAEEIAFADAHIFPYSRRPGTIADKMPNQVEQAIKHKRASYMADICQKTQAEYIKKFVGKTLTVLFERENSSEWHQGHSENYLLVKVRRKDPEKSLKREIRKVKITKAFSNYCIGEFI